MNLESLTVELGNFYPPINNIFFPHLLTSLTHPRHREETPLRHYQHSGEPRHHLPREQELLHVEGAQEGPRVHYQGSIQD